MMEFIQNRLPIGQRGTFIYLIDDAAIAALLSEAGSVAGSAAGSVTAGGLGSGALGTGLTATELAGATLPTAAELGATSGGLTAAELGMSQPGHLSGDTAPLKTQTPELQPTLAEQGKDLGSQLMKPVKQVSELIPNVQGAGDKVSNGDVGGAINDIDVGSNLPGMDMMPSAGDIVTALFGSGDQGKMPEAPDLPNKPAPPMKPSTPGVPMSMQDKLSGAHDALRLASKLVNNKKDKQTIGFMSLGTALASNDGDMSKALGSLQGPIEDIGGGMEQPKEKEMKPISPLAAQPPPVMAPSRETSPSASAAIEAGLPPVSLRMDKRLGSNYGGF